MSWNYRVVKTKLPSGEDHFAIHEAYYNEQNEVNGITTEAVTVTGEDLKTIRWILERMQEALDKPVLDYEAITGESAYKGS